MKSIIRENLPADRRSFIGGSDARIILGDDESALLRLWREKRGEAEPVDLSGNLVVQLGAVTEELNRRWYEANTGQVITERRSPVLFGQLLHHFNDCRCVKTPTGGVKQVGGCYVTQAFVPLLGSAHVLVVKWHRAASPFKPLLPWSRTSSAVHSW